MNYLEVLLHFFQKISLIVVCEWLETVQYNLKSLFAILLSKSTENEVLDCDQDYRSEIIKNLNDQNFSLTMR